MIVLAGVFGAIFGWALADFESFGFFLGGFIGLGFGWILRRTVLAEIARATRPLQAQIDELMTRAFATSDAATRRDRPNQTVPARAAARVVTTAPPAEASREPVVHSAAEPAPASAGMIETAVAAAMSAARAWLFGGNTIVRIGLIILFVGLSFLASYAASAGLFPIELRIALIGAFGIALLVVGFRTRRGRPDFSLVLQGGGVAIIYLTLFAAAKLYTIFPIAAAFVLMIAVCALACMLALLQRSQTLAATAFAGGFAVPLLLSTGAGNVAILFAYYTLLNLSILVIAHRQSWRVLNLIGFLATFGVAAAWWMASYQPSDFWPAQLFVIVSVMIYVATAVLYTRATPGRLGNIADTTLLFGPALAGFGLQVGLVADHPFGSAFAALGFAALYLGVAGWTMRYRRESFRVMNEAMLAIGVGFVTLAIPLALGARWTSAAWALEGVGAFWVGMRQARWMPRLFGLMLQLVAAIIYFGGVDDNVAALPLANPGYVGAVLIACAALATAWWLRRPLPHSGSRMALAYGAIEGSLEKPAFLIGFSFWWLAWLAEAVRLVPSEVVGQSSVPVFDDSGRILGAMFAFIASAWVAQWAGRRLAWPVASWPSYASVPALVIGFIGIAGSGGYVLNTPDWAIWIAAIGIHVHMLYRNDADPLATHRQALLGAIHVGGVWLAVAIIANCLWLGIERAELWNTAWVEVTFLLATVAVLIVLSWWSGRALRAQSRSARWPLDRHAFAYGWYAALPIAGLTFIGTLFTALYSSGATDPLPYLPLINPVDLSLGIGLAGLELWRRTVLAADPAPSGAATLGDRGALAGLAALAFVVINTVWLRFAHHWLGVAWNGDALLGDVVVQTGLAILWTLLALALMVIAHRRGLRTLWLVGAGLLGLTVAKLLLVDLGAAGGGARIIAFIVVGLLMLVVGYLAPLPPRNAEPDEGSMQV